MSEEVIPTSFDDFLNPKVEPTQEEISEKQTLENRFAAERLQWSGKIKAMSAQLKTVVQVGELMTEIYTERQRGLEYYHYLISLLIKINKNYRKQYAEKHEFYTYKAQQRFTNETSKNTQIQSELGELLEKREALDNHAKFMDGTIKTIDNIIFGLKSRIEIEQISRGK